MIELFGSALVTFLVIIDPPGCAPIFAGLTKGTSAAHRTALLPVDLERIGTECGLREVTIVYTRWGRVPLTPWHYPAAVASLWPGGLSDNVVMVGRR